MFTRPQDLSDGAVAATVRGGWGLEVESVAYIAVGFGSHHWSAVSNGSQWFVTVDDLQARLRDPSDSLSAARRRLETALMAAAGLQRRGLPFVVAPLPSIAGDVLELVDGRYVLALYPHVAGRTASWGRYETQADRFAVVDRLVQVHATDPVIANASADDFCIPARHRLQAALAQTSASWSTGPFGEPARTLLASHADAVRRALGWYDERADRVGHLGRQLVVTHGEPHAGNAIFTATGPALIDWDTALVAPHERDLWALVDEDPEVASYYIEESGRGLDRDTMQLYRLGWDLCEISLYVAEFSEPHIESADTRTAWRGLERYLDPSRWANLG